MSSTRTGRRSRRGTKIHVRKTLLQWVYNVLTDRRRRLRRLRDGVLDGAAASADGVLDAAGPHDNFGISSQRARRSRTGRTRKRAELGGGGDTGNRSSGSSTGSGSGSRAEAARSPEAARKPRGAPRTDSHPMFLVWTMMVCHRPWVHMGGRQPDFTSLMRSGRVVSLACFNLGPHESQLEPHTRRT